VQNSATDVHSENAFAWELKAVNALFLRSAGAPGIFVPVQRQMDRTQRNLTSSFQGMLKPLADQLTTAAFDRARYHVDWGEEGKDNGFVVASFTIDPWRQFWISIDRIQENFQFPPDSGTVKTWARVQFEEGGTRQVRGGDRAPFQDCFVGDPPVFQYYKHGLRYVVVHVLIHRAVMPQTIHGRIERRDDGYYVHWENGEVDYLGPDFDIDQVPPGSRDGDELVRLVWPPVHAGTARQFDLRVDYAMQTISTRIDGNEITAVNGEQIHIPGDSSRPENWPDVWLTVRVDGSRTPKLPGS
jgi:hypothetical protein